MGTVGHRGAALANFGGAGTGIESAGLGNIHRALVECAKGISPRKTWAYLASLIGASERVAKHRMAGSREFSIDELARMLRSERGIDYLVTIMGNAEPQWWHAFKKQVAVSDSIRMQRAARRKLQEAIDADADLSAAITRAAVLQDEDFHRPQVDALRASGGLQNRSVASATKRR
jgi:hypothetical protein